MAENIEIKIPISSVIANPRTIPDPSQINIKAVMTDAIFESRIESHARENPVSIASRNDFPFSFSSFNRSKIKMLASTAAPMDKIKPAIPASVNVTGISLNTAKFNNV